MNFVRFLAHIAKTPLPWNGETYLLPSAQRAHGTARLEIISGLGVLTLCMSFSQDFCGTSRTPRMIRNRKATPKTLCDKDFAELSGDFLARFASKPLFNWVVPSNCLENYLVLFVRFLPWWFFLALEVTYTQIDHENDSLKSRNLRCKARDANIHGRGLNASCKNRQAVS